MTKKEELEIELGNIESLINISKRSLNNGMFYSMERYKVIQSIKNYERQRASVIKEIAFIEDIMRIN